MLYLDAANVDKSAPDRTVKAAFYDLDQDPAKVVTSAGGAVQFTDAANLDVQGISAPGQTVTLTANGAGRTLSETAGIINAGKLSLRARARRSRARASTAP